MTAPPRSKLTHYCDGLMLHFGQTALRILLKIRGKCLIFRAANSGNRVEQKELGNNDLPLKCRLARSPKGRYGVAVSVGDCI